MKYILILAAAFLVFSCTKEKSTENGNNTGGTAKDSLLVKLVIHNGTDSTVANFGYDNSRRLISDHILTTDNGTSYNDDYTLRRNSQGIITQTIEKSDSLKVHGIDSLVYVVSYDGTKARYTSRVATVTVSGNTIKDSITYSYDASGKIIEADEYGSNGQVPYVLIYKEVFSYDSFGSIADVKNYSVDPSTGASTAQSDETFAYDTRVNPLSLGNEALLLDQPEVLSKFNVITDNYTQYQPTMTNEVTSYTYVYNSLDKPDRGTVTLQGGNPNTVTYYYQ